ncbi:response regulator [Thermodesulfobacteriota bacterium]
MSPKPRILVVEDDPVIQTVLNSRLGKLGYEVLAVVSTGEEAIEKAQETRPDLVLMDIKLDGPMDGIEAAAEIRSSVGIPVVYVTAYAEDSQLKRARATEPFGYLVKPFGERELRSTLEMAFYKAEMEAKLRRSEERFRAITENTSDVTAVLDKEGTYAYLSPSVTRLIRYLPEEMLGKKPADFVHADDISGLEDGIRKAVDSPGETFCINEFRLRRQDGEWAHLEGRVTCLYDTPGIEGVVLNGRDIGDRKRSEALMVQSAKYKAVADLATGVAHNFNNLLQVILGNASFAMLNLELGDYSQVGESLEQITQSSRFGAEVVKRLEKFAGVRQLGGRSKMEVIDLSEVVRLVVEMTTPLWKTLPEKSGVEIQLELKLKQNCWVHAKKDEIFEVVVNLLKNAVEALPKGGKIELTTRLEGNRAQLIVNDTGLGIPKDKIGRLFTPFFTTRSEPGRGLGLAQSRRILERHEGHIFLESKKDEGTLVTVELPLSSEAPPATEGDEVMDSDVSLNILVIDDMKPIVNMLANGLQQYNQKVFTALSGQEGIDIFTEETIDLVICDLGMPGMNGWQVGKRITEISKKRGQEKPLFLILTGWGDQSEELGLMKESGVDGVVQKPVHVKKLLQVIAEIRRKALQKR